MNRRALLTALLFAAAPGAALASGGGKKNESAHLALRPVTTTVIRPNRRRGAMIVEVGLNIPDAHLREQAQLSQPVLRDAYLSVLQPYALRLTPGAPPDTEVIARMLQRETDRVLKHKGARVLLGGVLIN